MEENGKGVSLRGVKVFLVSLFIVGLAAYIYVTNDVSALFRKAAADVGGGQTFSETGYKLPYGAQSAPSFYSSDAAKGFFYATKDGIKFISDAGDTKMSAAYSFSAPKLAACGGFVAVGEQKSGGLFVFDENGQVYEQSAKNPILSFSVSARGESCVITQKEENYLIQVFNAGGKLIHEVLQSSSQNIFPALSAISDDGRILAVVGYDAAGVSVRSQITFYYLNKQESIDYRDAMFGANDDFADEIVFAVKFMSGNKLAVISDKTVSCVDAETKCAKIWKAEHLNEVDGIYFDKEFVALAYGNAHVNKLALPVGTIKLYRADMAEKTDEEGTKTFDGEAEIEARGRVTYLNGSAKGIITGRGRTFTAYSPKGAELWTFTPLADVRDVLFVNGTNKILAAYENNVVVLER